ncbi:hypothetical protein [Halocatena salina]|nr:hypothetical protein [Halocatena salina]
MFDRRIERVRDEADDEDGVEHAKAIIADYQRESGAVVGSEYE